MSSYDMRRHFTIHSSEYNYTIISRLEKSNTYRYVHRVINNCSTWFCHSITEIEGVVGDQMTLFLKICTEIRF